MRETRKTEHRNERRIWEMTEKISDDEAGNVPGPAGSGESGAGAKMTDMAGTRTWAGGRP